MKSNHVLIAIALLSFTFGNGLATTTTAAISETAAAMEEDPAPELVHFQSFLFLFFFFLVMVDFSGVQYRDSVIRDIQAAKTVEMQMEFEDSGAEMNKGVQAKAGHQRRIFLGPLQQRLNRSKKQWNFWLYALNERNESFSTIQFIHFLAAFTLISTVALLAYGFPFNEEHLLYVASSIVFPVVVALIFVTQLIIASWPLLDTPPSTAVKKANVAMNSLKMLSIIPLLLLLAATAFAVIGWLIVAYTGDPQDPFRAFNTVVFIIMFIFSIFAALFGMMQSEILENNALQYAHQGSSASQEKLGETMQNRNSEDPYSAQAKVHSSAWWGASKQEGQ